MFHVILQEEIGTGEGGSEEIVSELLPYDIVGDVAVISRIAVRY